MKRSKTIRLILIGSLSAAVLAGCDEAEGPAPISENCVYTNNFYVAGVGYYHAPFRAFYSIPYNHFDSQRQMYFFGGQWDAMPHVSITNISPPTAQAAQQAEAERTDVSRGGFGGSAGYFGGHVWS